MVVTQEGMTDLNSLLLHSSQSLQLVLTEITFVLDFFAFVLVLKCTEICRGVVVVVGWGNVLASTKCRHAPFVCLHVIEFFMG